VIALVSAAAARHLDEDLPPLVAALDDVGVANRVEVWDDDVDWSNYELVVLRSAWDYAPRRAEFVRWAEDVSAVTTLANSLDVVRWSTDKHYLHVLQAAGVPVTPTVFVEPGERPWPAWPDGDVVVKPAISAGSADTALHRRAHRDVAIAHVASLVDAGRAVMVQPYLHAIDEGGETALVFIEGRFSHAIRKGPILAHAVDVVGGLFAQEDIRPRTPSQEELAVADAALDAVPMGRDALLYGRVDLVPGPDGAPVVLELELCEPSMYFDHADGSAARFAGAIARRMTRRG